MMIAEGVVLKHKAPVPLEPQMIRERKGCWWNGVKCGWHGSKRPGAAACEMEHARSFLGTLNA
jgi:hypothetical protein